MYSSASSTWTVAKTTGVSEINQRKSVKWPRETTRQELITKNKKFKERTEEEEPTKQTS